MKEISGGELLKILDRGDVTIIDVRPSDAYNGWAMRGEKQGGHVKNARSLPLKWLNYYDWIEIVRSKNIPRENTIVIYGYKTDDLERAASAFLKAGYYNLISYNHFEDEWSGNMNFPVQYLPRFKNLVYPGWVNMLISGVKPPLYENNNFRIIHAHYRNRDAYLSGHIPLATDIDTLELEAPETWNRRTPEELKAAFERNGITANTTVVLYGKYMSPDRRDPFPGSAAGDIGAMRCAFIMMYAGVKDVRVLNGGFQSWIDEGLPVHYNNLRKIPVKDFGSLIHARAELAVDTPEAKRMLKDPGSDLVCVRSLSEYLGEESGYNYIEKKGRIPGAIFADSGSDAYHMENYRNVDHTVREYHETYRNWEKRGITPDKHLAFYCGTGWRGSEAFFNAWLMGYPMISVYDGGWFEWSNDPENPVETGMPEKTEELTA
jgi:thiosulfate/3-mercaptopyruvate sulfurtransferase